MGIKADGLIIKMETYILDIKVLRDSTIYIE